MMITLDTLNKKYKLNITGVVHVGAHLAEEAKDYADHGISPVWWIEGNPELIGRIADNVRGYPGNQVVQALVYEADDVDLGFNITNMDGMSSSILDWGTHPLTAPQCVFAKTVTLRTKTLDTIVAEHGITGANLLNMDLQGAEMHALKGAEKLLESVDYIFSEVNVDELYAGCVRLWELDAWLAERGFIRTETCMAENNVGWGDGFWIRRPAV
jgi:FkbM family methyltransferase